MWSGAWEAGVRIGNGHMSSIRAASYTECFHQHPEEFYLGALLLFLVVAACCYRVASPNTPRDLHAPEGVLLH
jgi:hypothetical protein